jgi:hypothetical protein
MPGAIAQFGIGKKAEIKEGADAGFTDTADADANLPLVNDDLVDRLMAANQQLTEQQAVDLAYVLEQLEKDPETQLLLSQLKSGTGREHLESFAADMDLSQIVHGLAVGIAELQMLDELFKDPQRAFDIMYEEGMIEEDKVDDYRKDPSLLQEDTRKSVFFTFVSLGAAGGFLEEL